MANAPAEAAGPHADRWLQLARSLVDGYQPGTALYAIILALVWQGFPFFAIMILAGLQAIPAALYEAAAIDADTRYVDADGDGWGDDALVTIGCPALGFVAVGGDCDDGDAARHPSAVEDCDGVDDDCDGLTDDADPDVEPADLVVLVSDLFAAGELDGLRVVVTAGPTWEAIDPVRGLTNRSSGKMGYVVAQAAMEAGANVTLIVHTPPMSNCSPSQPAPFANPAPPVTRGVPITTG